MGPYIGSCIVREMVRSTARYMLVEAYAIQTGAKYAAHSCLSLVTLTIMFTTPQPLGQASFPAELLFHKVCSSFRAEY